MVVFELMLLLVFGMVRNMLVLLLLWLMGLRVVLLVLIPNNASKIVHFIPLIQKSLIIPYLFYLGY